MKKVLAIIEQQQDVFATYHYRPKRASGVVNWSDRITTSIKQAIVLQGPLLADDDFTLETIKLYKKQYQDAITILSTWEDEDAQLINCIQKMGVNVVLSKKPEYAGIFHINYQIVSSKNGIDRAKELGAEYVMKTRTDQRVYAPNVPDYLYNLISIFPVEGRGQHKQLKRIIGSRLNTFKYRMYGLSDMFTYGHIDDMILFWNTDCDSRVFTKEQRREAESGSLRKFAEWRVCEVYLVTEFLKKIGRYPKWTLRDSWEVIAEYFCIVDNEQLDLFWPKYNRREFRWLDYSKDKERQQEMTFRDWLDLYLNIDEYSIPEEVLDV